MEKRVNNKYIFTALIIFLITYLIYTIYASLSLRGLFNDGAHFVIKILDNISSGIFSIEADIERPRFVVHFLLDFPLYVAKIFAFDSKKNLLILYSFMQFILPFIFLVWNYRLSKKTEKYHIFALHFAVFVLFLLPCQIYSICEFIIGSGAQFILINYLLYDKEYKIPDIAGIIFCLIMLFGTYEHVAIISPFIAVYAFMLAYKSDSANKKTIKGIIGIISLISSVCLTLYMMNIPDGSEDFFQSIKELLNENYKFAFGTCFLYSAVAVILYFIFSVLFKKIPKFISLLLIIISFLLCAYFTFKTVDFDSYLRFTIAFRRFSCLVLILSLIRLVVYHKPFKFVDYKSFLFITVVCGIMQTSNQIWVTNMWNDNIDYVKNSLNSCDTIIYNPVSDNTTIFYWTYPVLSVLLSDSYEIKTLSLPKESEFVDEETNMFARRNMFTADNNKMSLPLYRYINIKNKYWDLTEASKALSKINKEQNINEFRYDLTDYKELLETENE